MPVIETTILSKILDWLIVVVAGGALFLFRKLLKHGDTLGEHETLLALCEQRDKQRETHRLEDKELRNQQRREIMKKIDDHHKTVMNKLDSL